MIQERNRKTRTVFRDPKHQAIWESCASLAIIILLVFPGAYILGTWKVLEFAYTRAGMAGISGLILVIAVLALMIAKTIRDPEFRERYLTTQAYD